MKINFYAVYIQNGKNKESIDLLNGISTKVINNRNNALEIEDYFLYAHHINGDCFLITKTFDSALVKRINKKTLSVDEIKNALGSDETIAFPSFLLIKGNIIGYANTQHGPRTRDLHTFLTKKIDIPTGYKLCIEPLMRDVTKDDALDMQFIGRTTLRVETGSKFLSPLLRATGIEKIDEELLDGIEITIKPKRTRNIKDMAKQLIKNSDDEYSDILIKGREQAADLLTDYYLSNKGHLASNIYKSKNEEIADEMETCFIRMKSVIMKSYNDTYDDKM